jgi:NitT/TauT family transport system ATP-binding protein
MDAAVDTPTMTGHVQFRDVSKWYETRAGGHVHALSHVNIDIREHEFVALLGASGCGKSTMLKILAGLIPPTAGEVVVGGARVAGPRHDYGYVFQEALLLPWRTILDNILLVGEVQGRNKREMRERAMDLLELVELVGFEDKYPSELSGGMQQRVGVVRALVNDPTLLLMDEPFAALDALTRETMGLELLRIWERDKKTVVFVTHSISEAVLLADRVVTMSPRPGRVVNVTHVPLPRPRSVDDMRTEVFAETVGGLREILFRTDTTIE